MKSSLQKPILLKNQLKKSYFTYFLDIIVQKTSFVILLLFLFSNEKWVSVNIFCEKKEDKSNHTLLHFSVMYLME